MTERFEMAASRLDFCCLQETGWRVRGQKVGGL